jgi:hypothetical protein
MVVATQHDLQAYLDDPTTRAAALAHLKALMDEEWGYDAAGGWVLVGGGGLARLGLSRAEAVALGAEDRAVEEPAGPPLESLITAKAAEVQTEKCRARDAGFRVDGVLFDSDQSARTAYLELADMLAAVPAYSTPWKASPGAWVTMDAVLYAKVRAAGAAHVSACFAWQAVRDAELAAVSAAVVDGRMTAREARTAIAAVSTSYPPGNP